MRLVRMERSMQRLSKPKTRAKIGRALAIAAALLGATALSQPNLAYAGPRGGGGDFHGGGGGFHGGAFHAMAGANGGWLWRLPREWVSRRSISRWPVPRRSISR